MDVTTATDLSEEFMFGLCYHATLASSVARKLLVGGLHQVRRDFRMEKWDKFTCSKEEPFATDWRVNAGLSDILVSLVGHNFKAVSEEKSYKENVAAALVKHSEEGKEGQQISENIQNSAEGKGKATFGDGEGGGDEGKQASKKRTKYTNTNWSFLAFLRNDNEHLPEHAIIEDPDEAEIYMSASFENFLPDLIKRLLNIGKMSGMFRSTWSAYKACVRCDIQEPPNI